MRADDQPLPKYLQIFESLRTAIATGRYRVGQALPSEHALVRRWKVARPTAARALRDLEIAGLVERRRGAGTFVRAHRTPGLLLGMLVTGLGRGEIFAPICDEIASAARARGLSVAWPEDAGDDHSAEALCASLVDQRVSGVFFSPVEFEMGKETTNQRIVDLLCRNDIPVVLLDADVELFPGRSAFDLIGVDNRRIGYRQTLHAALAGCRRIDFVSLLGSAPSVAARAAGWDDGVTRISGARAAHSNIHATHAIDQAFVSELSARGLPDAFVCSNDGVAAALVAELGALGVEVPGQVRVLGVDDVFHATSHAVPLTTVRQPCRAIGRTAVETMCQRLADRGAPARDVLLDAPLVIRKSA